MQNWSRKELPRGRSGSTGLHLKENSAWSDKYYHIKAKTWEEYEYYQKLRDEQFAELKQENADKDAEIAKLKRKLAEAKGEAWFWNHAGKMQLDGAELNHTEPHPRNI